MDDDKKIDPSDPIVVIAFIIAFFGDISFFLIITHWIAGIIVLAILWPRFKGWLPRLNFALCVLVPLPILMIGIFQGILLSNKLIAFLTEQVAIQGIAALTGGAGEALEGAALAEEGGALAAEGIEAGSAAAEAGEAAEAGAVATEGAEAGEAAEPESAKPSENSTERGKEREGRRKLHRPSDKDDEDEESEEADEEDEREKYADERYEELMTPEAEKNPIDVAKEEELGDEVPIRKAPPKVEDIRSGRNRAATKRETTADQLPFNRVQEDDDDEEENGGHEEAA